MKISILHTATLVLCGLAFASCNNKKAQEAKIHPYFETSYWIDLDLAEHSMRGYWRPVESLDPEEVPDSASIANATRMLAEEYGADKLYVVYHRQFELDDARRVFGYWKTEGDRNGLEIVPTVVIESYAEPATMNFSDSTICDFATWCTKNVNPDEFGIYDVYIRQGEGTPQDTQMGVLRNAIGDRLVRVGLQPGEDLNRYCIGGVEDTWTAECQGLTDELWENPDSVNGTDLYGRKLLASWVAERADTAQPRRIVWDMIPVAWDYDKPVDEYGYVCPGDDALINDPPLPERIAKCHECIVAGYPEGMLTEKFGGYSCDLHILQANSAGHPDSISFYRQLRNGEPYTGYFASAMEQVSALYKEIADLKNGKTEMR